METTIQKTPKIQGRIVCYARVSKLDMNPENQYEDLKNRASQLGEFELLTELESTRNTRPIKEELTARCRRGEVTTVLVWKLDRFARSTSELSLNLEEMKRLKVRFISIRDGLDLNPENISPIQTFQYHILSSFAELERDLIRERTIAGLERARQQGKMLGRPVGAKDKKQRKTKGYYK